MIFFEQERNRKISLFNVEASRDGNKFVDNVEQKPVCCVRYIHFDSFLPSPYKVGLV